jgi:hypothetical protein
MLVVQCELAATVRRAGLPVSIILLDNYKVVAGKSLNEALKAGGFVVHHKLMDKVSLI